MTSGQQSGGPCSLPFPGCLYFSSDKLLDRVQKFVENSDVDAFVSAEFADVDSGLGYIAVKPTASTRLDSE